MPKKAFTVCRLPLCKKLTLDGVCDNHKAEYERRRQDAINKRARIADSKRGSADSRGYNSIWRRVRKGFIEKHPFCVHCEEKGVINPADVVDHIVPHKGNKEVFWDRDNWQSLCYSCHSIKTVKEDGGFGRKARGQHEHNQIH